MNTQHLLSQVMTDNDAFYYSLYTRTLCCTLCHYRGTVKVYMNWCAVVQSVGVERIAPAAPLKFQEPLCSTVGPTGLKNSPPETYCMLIGQQ